MDATLILAWLGEATRLIEANRDHLTALDSAIGDADHGVNLCRGFLAARTAMEDKTPASPGAALTAIGNTLVSTVGGAAGPLYGTVFRASGAALGSEQDVSAMEFAEALEAAAAGVRRLGAANPGDKTMVDVLVPAADAFRSAVQNGDSVEKASVAAADAAAAGAEATTPMQARRGRASYLGARSMGHKDPGATSTALLFQALATVVDSETH